MHLDNLEEVQNIEEDKIDKVIQFHSRDHSESHASSNLPNDEMVELTPLN